MYSYTHLFLLASSLPDPLNTVDSFNTFEPPCRCDGARSQCISGYCDSVSWRLYLFDFRHILRLTTGPWHDTSPRWLEFTTR
jgi:hypothetical protein